MTRRGDAHRSYKACQCLGWLFAMVAFADASHAATAPLPQQGTASSPESPLEFSAEFLVGNAGAKLDISRFSSRNPEIAGMYRSDIYLNGRWLARRDIRMAGQPATPCLDADLLRLLNIDNASLSTEGQAILRQASFDGDRTFQDGRCQPIDRLTRDAKAEFDSGELRLDVAVPQASQARSPQGYVPPETWDYGLDAATLSYASNLFRISGDGEARTSAFIGLDGGVNLGRWRFRHRGDYDRAPSGAWHYTRLGNYAATDIPDWRASLVIGDNFTTGQLFPSFQFRGVSLAKDERMLPDSQRGFAPVIRGVAQSNAKVEIRQNNALLYSTTVPAGPFQIDDLYPTGYGGDLQVMVTESDGSQKLTSVPFSSLPQLLREGTLDYSVTAGRLLGYLSTRDAVQATAQFGLNNAITVDGGLLATRDYSAILVGGALNSEAGAFQLNLSAADFEGAITQNHHGWSLDSGWSKVFAATDTNVSLAGYRYSTSGFYSLDDAMRYLDLNARSHAGFALTRFRVKGRAVLSINQALGGGASFFIVANSQNYWGSNGSSTLYQLGVNKQFGPLQVSFSATHGAPIPNGLVQNTFALGLNLPLGSFPAARSTASTFISHDNQTGDSRQFGLYGSGGDQGQWSYSLSERYARAGDALSASSTYRAPFATFRATATAGHEGDQQSATMAGGVVFADGHLTLAPALGSTIGLARVEGARNVRLNAAQAADLDADGYTVLPYLSPYSANTVELDLSKTPLSARFDRTSAVVAPHEGAVVFLNFQRLGGYTLMLRARRPDGTQAPFGASVFDEEGALVGNVGQAGRIQASSARLSGVLRVAWGEDDEASCLVHYHLAKPVSGDESMLQGDVVCVPAQARSRSQEPAAKAERKSISALSHPSPTFSAPEPTHLLPLPQDGTPAEALDVHDAIRAWADAWSRRDVNAYLSAYTDDFASGALSHPAWAQERRSRIEPRRHIAVAIFDLKIHVNGEEAEAKFLQSYESEIFKESRRKTLRLVRGPAGKWLIHHEAPSRLDASAGDARRVSSAPPSRGNRAE